MGIWFAVKLRECLENMYLVKQAQHAEIISVERERERTRELFNYKRA